MIFAVRCHWIQFALRVVLFALLFLVPAKMPVFSIAFRCNYDKRNTPEGTSFHRLPLNKPSLFKQVKISLMVEQPKIERSSHLR